jgi:AcrR family transcriptional regulator
MAKAEQKIVQNVKQLKRATTDEHKDLRRTAILSAAKSVFAQKGYHATTIAEVAKKAKMSYGSIYWYFDSKDTLFHELMRFEEQELNSAINEAVSLLPKDATVGETFRAAVRATFEFFENDKDVVKLIFRDSLSLGPKFETHLFKIYENFIDKIEQVVKEAQRQGIVINAPARVISYSIAALIGQVALRRLVTNDGLSASVVADFIVDLLFYGIAPR